MRLDFAWPMGSPVSRCQESEGADERSFGAYGLQLRGVAAPSLLVEAAADWPELNISQQVGEGEIQQERVTADHAEVRLRAGGRLDIGRMKSLALYTVPRLLRDDELVHPYLAPAAAIVSRWLGRESLHAGAFLAGGGAWALLGARESGKSSTLACLAKAGHEIVTDDMLILDRQRVYFGPRSVDLRREAAEQLGTGSALGMTGARERWRLDVGGGSATPAPLLGCVFLEWGERLELVELSGSERLERLFVHRGVRLPPTDPAALLEVAALKGFELRRPPGWEALDEAVELLLDRVAA
jgi:hypothetical protein